MSGSPRSTSRRRRAAGRPDGPVDQPDLLLHLGDISFKSTEAAMTSQVSELMDQVLRVFGERDDAARRSVIDTVFAEDVKFADAEGVSRRRDAVDSKVRGTPGRHPCRVRLHPGRSGADGRRSRVPFLDPGPAGQPPVVSGTDVITVRDGTDQPPCTRCSPAPARGPTATLRVVDSSAGSAVRHQVLVDPGQRCGQVRGVASRSCRSKNILRISAA